MIAVVVVGKSDLNAKVTDRLIVELRARLGRFIHGNGRERIAIVALLLECDGKCTTRQRQNCRMIARI